eukprot:COSAG04_NODE_705_length_10946_cov_208.154052_3_plen_92_part_00
MSSRAHGDIRPFLCLGEIVYQKALHPTKVTAPTEIIVSELWLPASSLDVKVSDAAAMVRIESKLAGAKLTDGVAYPALPGRSGGQNLNCQN